jgi:hypothetical protein
MRSRVFGDGSGARRRAAALVAALVTLAVAQAAAASAPSRTLQLVKARMLAGSFAASQDVWADSHRVYLASVQGKLFVLARDRRAGFPTVQVVRVSTSQLAAVRGDASHVYVLARDGVLRVYRRRAPLVLQRVRRVLPAKDGRLGSLVVLGGRIYVSGGAIAVDQRHVFVAANDVAAAYDVKHLVRRVTYAGRSRADTTSVYDRASGRRVAAIRHGPGQGLLYVDDRVLAIYGLDDGATTYDPRTFAKRATIPARDAGRTGLARQGRWLLTSDILATVSAFDLNALPALSFSSVDLLRELGFERAPDAIHIYGGLWTDAHDGLIFAGGSEFVPWEFGLAPTFFVLELRTPTPQSTLASLIDARDRAGIRTWAAGRSIAAIDDAVAGLDQAHRTRLADVVLATDATGADRARLLRLMGTVLAHRELGFFAEVWSYTDVHWTGDGFFGGCNNVWLSPEGFGRLGDGDAADVFAHESFHSFDCVNGGPAGALDEGAAIWVYKGVVRGDLRPGESWAEATYGTKLWYRDIQHDPGYPLGAPVAPTAKLRDVYRLLASIDPSRLPWNDGGRLVTCFDRYFVDLNRDVDFVTVWLPEVAARTQLMLADSTCRPLP